MVPETMALGYLCYTEGTGAGLSPVASLPVQTAFEMCVAPQGDGVSLMSQH